MLWSQGRGKRGVTTPSSLLSQLRLAANPPLHPTVIPGLLKLYPDSMAYCEMEDIRLLEGINMQLLSVANA